MERTSYPIDRISFQLGMINCFIEMVACGVKRLALSPPVSPEDYAAIGPLSDEAVRRFGIHSTLEKSLLVTDLQPEEFTKGKWSILYFAEESVLHEYEALKNRKERLEGTGSYDAHDRRELSRDFMRLLSYPEAQITERLSRPTEESPFMLVDD
jgi:hypothetical protein